MRYKQLYLLDDIDQQSLLFEKTHKFFLA